MSGIEQSSFVYKKIICTHMCNNTHNEGEKGESERTVGSVEGPWVLLLTLYLLLRPPHHPWALPPPVLCLAFTSTLHESSLPSVTNF